MDMANKEQSARKTRSTRTNTPPVKAAAKRPAKKPAAAKKAGGKKAKQPTTRADRQPQAVRVIRTKLADNPDRPVLELCEPLPLGERYDDSIGGRLQALYDVTKTTPDMLADRLDMARSGVWRWAKKDDAFFDLARLRQIAEVYGFEPSAWLMPLPGFLNATVGQYEHYGIKYGDSGNSVPRIADYDCNNDLITGLLAA